MLKKSSLAFCVSLVVLAIGAYAAGDKPAASDPGIYNAPADQATKKTLTKEEALKAGLTEAQFKAADTNHDGKLDQKELDAARLDTNAQK